MSKHMTANRLDATVSNVVSLSIKPDETIYVCVSRAGEAGEKFLQAAGELPEGQCLGLDLSCKAGGEWSNIAYSSENAKVKMEDYNWIFQGCADAGEPGCGDERNCLPEGCKVYELLYRAGAETETAKREPAWHSGFDDERPSLFDYFKELAGMMEQSGAEIRIIASGRTSGNIMNP